MNSQARVFLVDDDAAVRDSIALLLEVAGYAVTTFSCAGYFLDFCTPEHEGCIILDLNMPGMNGTELQQELLRRGIQMPIIFLSGHATIPATVHAIKAGAMDFLTKPVQGSELLKSVKDGMQRSAQIKRQAKKYQMAVSRLSMLTEREREIMTLVVIGLSSKEIAQRLDISYRTVETHRTRAMHKANAANLLEFARIVSVAEAN
jgi:FixJ family two-component response regulator